MRIRGKRNLKEDIDRRAPRAIPSHLEYGDPDPVRAYNNVTRSQYNRAKIGRPQYAANKHIHTKLDVCAKTLSIANERRGGLVGDICSGYRLLLRGEIDRAALSNFEAVRYYFALRGCLCSSTCRGVISTLGGPQKYSCVLRLNAPDWEGRPL